MIEKICKECSRHFEVYPYRKDSAIYCSQSCKAKQPKSLETRERISESLQGVNSWSLGRSPSNKGKGKTRGYRVKIINRKYVKEHHLVWCSQPGNLSFVPKDCVIHHINLDHLDNRPENLVLLPKVWHDELHWQLRKLGGK